jgi:hypothetical protein
LGNLAYKARQAASHNPGAAVTTVAELITFYP